MTQPHPEARGDQIARAPMLANEMERLGVLRPDMAQMAEDAADRDDLTPAIRFFQAVGGALAFVAVIGALVGLYLVTP